MTVLPYPLTSWLSRLRPTPFLLAAVPQVVLCFWLMFRMKRLGRHGASAACKGLGTWVILCFGGLGALRTLVTPGAAAAAGAPAAGRWAVFWLELGFFLLCLLADLLLEYWFVPGVAVFACAHGCLIALLLVTRQPGRWLCLPLWAALLCLTLLLFRRELPAQKKLAPVLVGYAGVLSLMLALFGERLLYSLLTPAAWGGPLLFFAGALCFYVSDLFVAKLNFSGLDPKWEKAAMALYWLALLLLARAVWGA